MIINSRNMYGRYVKISDKIDDMDDLLFEFEKNDGIFINLEELKEMVEHIQSVIEKHEENRS